VPGGTEEPEGQGDGAAAPASSPAERAEAWLREELDPFVGPHFWASNSVPFLLAALLTLWFVLLSGVYGSGDVRVYLASSPRGISNYIISLGGLAVIIYILAGNFRRWLGEWAFTATATVVSLAYLLPQGFLYYRLKAGVAYVLGLYFINRLRHVLHQAASRPRD
jgi:hypothetical protein